MWNFKKFTSVTAATAIAATAFVAVPISAGAAINTEDDIKDGVTRNWVQAKATDARVVAWATDVAADAEGNTDGFAYKQLTVQQSKEANHTGVYHGTVNFGSGDGKASDYPLWESGIRIGEQKLRFSSNSQFINFYIGSGKKDGGRACGAVGTLASMYYTPDTHTLSITSGSETKSVVISENKWYSFAYVADYNVDAGVEVTVYCYDNTTLVDSVKGNTATKYKLNDFVVTSNTYDANQTQRTVDVADSVIYTVGASDANTISISGDEVVEKEQLESTTVEYTAEIKHNNIDNIDISDDIANTVWTVTDQNDQSVAGAAINNGVVSLGTSFPTGTTTLKITAARGTTTDSKNLVVTNNASSDTNYYNIAFTATNGTDPLTPVITVKNSDGNVVSNWATEGLQNGSYTYSAECNYYNVATGSFTVSGNDLTGDNAVNVVMSPAEYSATITTNPYAKLVITGQSYVDGEVAKTIKSDANGAASVMIPAGAAYNVAITKGGYNADSTSLTVEGNGVSVTKMLNFADSNDLYYEDFENAEQNDKSWLTSGTNMENSSIVSESDHTSGNGMKIVNNQGNTRTAYKTLGIAADGTYKIKLDYSVTNVSQTATNARSQDFSFRDENNKVIFGLSIRETTAGSKTFELYSYCGNGSNNEINSHDYDENNAEKIADLGNSCAYHGTITATINTDKKTVVVKAGDNDEITFTDKSLGTAVNSLRIATEKGSVTYFDNIRISDYTAGEAFLVLKEGDDAPSGMTASNVDDEYGKETTIATAFVTNALPKDAVKNLSWTINVPANTSYINTKKASNFAGKATGDEVIAGTGIKAVTTEFNLGVTAAMPTLDSGTNVVVGLIIKDLYTTGAATITYSANNDYDNGGEAEKFTESGLPNGGTSETEPNGLFDEVLTHIYSSEELQILAVGDEAAQNEAVESESVDDSIDMTDYTDIAVITE